MNMPQPEIAHQTFTQVLPLQLHYPQSGATEATFHYTSTDPWAVHLHIPVAAGKQITWSFARQLLYDGVIDTTRVHGDVHITTRDAGTGERTFITLRSPSGEALLSADPDDLIDAITATEHIVPWQTEDAFADVDDAVEGLLPRGVPRLAD